VAFLPGQPGAELARRAVGARLEALIAPPALATAGHEELLAVAREVAELLLRVRVAYHGTNRYRDVEVRAAASGAVVGGPRRAVPGLESARDAKVGKRVY